MKKKLLIFFLISHALIADAQNVNFVWGKQMGGTNWASGYSVITDAAGNVYTTGAFSGTADFDPGPGTYNLSTDGSYDMFVSKLDVAGNFVWAKQMGGTDSLSDYAEGSSIVLDASGNIYLTGDFGGIVDFDPGPAIFNLQTNNYPIPGLDNWYYDCFVLKLDAAGNFVWAKRMGGDWQTWGASIALDASGNIYTFGGLYGTADFDPGPGIYNLTDWGVFISKLDGAGNFIWARATKVTPGSGPNQHADATAGRMTLDAAGNIYCTGSFWGEVDFNPAGSGFILLADLLDIYIWKLTAAGNFVWAKQMGGTQFDTGTSIALDASGNIYTAGTFSGTADFDPGTGTYNLTATGNNDKFVSKLDGAGNFVWAKQMGETQDEWNSFIALDVSGNIYATGKFFGTVDFDPGPGTYNLTALGGDMSISKLDMNGNFIWAKQMGGAGAITNVYSIALDAFGNIYTTGNFNNTVDFDPGSCIFTLTSIGATDMFINKMSPCINGSNFITAVVCNSYTLNNQTYTATGVYTQIIPGASCCDSIITINLTVKPTSFSAINATICAGQNYSGYSVSGIFIDTLSAINGCDSIRTLNLTVKPTSFSAINATICPGQNYSGYSVSGIYIDTLAASNGCDSVRTINLTVKPASSSTATQSICQGQSYSGHSVSGTYIDTLVAANGCDSVQTLHLTVYPAYSSVIDTTICYGQNFEGHHSSGTYNTIYQTINGCDSARTIKLTVLPDINPLLGKDTSICTGDSMVLYPGQFSTYTWQNGSAQSHLTIKQPGLYSIMVTDNCGSASDEILVKEGICDIYFPSAFTPNNDGKNDLFKVLGASHLNDFHLVVYNRWGQKVFETKDYTKGWTGKLNGQLLDTGVFIWYCEFKKNGNNNIIKMKGTVVLIR